jgi:erythromycin esterase
MPRTVPVFLALLLTLSTSAAPKRRAVRVPPSFDTSTVAGWLAVNAHPLASTELQPYSYDLEPLRTMIGDADVVALGEGTHGTHEFHAVKLRAVDFLVREMGFDVIAFEAPFPLFNRINAYALGGAGNPRVILSELWDLGYFFWDAEEILALVEWMREYNATRGARPPVQIAGMDVLDQVTASNDVVEYLRTVDPPAAVKAEDDYWCIRVNSRFSECYDTAARLRDSLAAREAELVAQTSQVAFQDALQDARVVVQSQFAFGPHRDDALAQNALWIREHRGSTRRVIIWAHNEHVSRTSSEWAGEQPMGATLSAALGPEYFAVATLTGIGTFQQWAYDTNSQAWFSVKTRFTAIQPHSYESYFHQSTVAAYFFSLHGAQPSWIMTPARYNAGTTNQNNRNFVTGALPAKFDAAIYIDQTTPTKPLNH